MRYLFIVFGLFSFSFLFVSYETTLLSLNKGTKQSELICRNPKQNATAQ
jgi:hypothetical protein